MWGLVISLIMAIVIGFIGDALADNMMPGGIIGAAVAGLAGAWVGNLLFGNFGPNIAGFAIIPAVLGTAIFVLFLGLIAKLFRRAA
ncbi:GlsB/YeaQ/YmgE family stress response membrane protein [Saccharibacillus sp. CPCC 101409]|uniref:GlsB/YeaQ/YmgE family stress response membrane protein n=1 Tax=Saccharibacillus sp. CPCC 101409 TaxID=3058041 RepID=UPI00267268C9|nr:GlsB/YeaQ/YmgE family stress response membrane protein [Saccharibacillus sp. CPCC 101409]MDO3412793.1 GlsB/YeaQ/YmgE family stress response membrane protein [Saccharibacillus sp. CPCC 101409]